MKIAILGRTEVLYETACAIANTSHEIVLIATCAAAQESTVKEKDFQNLAKEFDVPFWNGANINSKQAQLMIKNSNADIGISMNWLTLISSETRNLFPLGILNAHAGDLPLYRGNACPNWAMLRGENRIGLCIHQMEDELDSGAIWSKSFYSINQKTRYSEIISWLLELTPKLYVDVLNKMEQGVISAIPQSTDPKDILRCYPRKPEDSRIDWNQSAFYLERLVNASSEPLPGAFAFYNNQKIRVWRAYAKRFNSNTCAMAGQVIFIDPKIGEVHIATPVDILVLQSISLENHVERISPSSIICSLRDRVY